MLDTNYNTDKRKLTGLGDFQGKKEHLNSTAKENVVQHDNCIQTRMTRVLLGRSSSGTTC